MIQLVRPCHSPACRGAAQRQVVNCTTHPGRIDCRGTCTQALEGRVSVCTFCGGENPVDPPEEVPFSMDPERRRAAQKPRRPRTRPGAKPAGGGGGRKRTPAREEGSGEKRASGSRRKGRRGRRNRRRTGGSGSGGGAASG